MARSRQGASEPRGPARQRVPAGRRRGLGPGPQHYGGMRAGRAGLVRHVLRIRRFHEGGAMAAITPGPPRSLAGVMPTRTESGEHGS